MSKKSLPGAAFLLVFLNVMVYGESIRVLIAGSREISLEKTENTPLPLAYFNSALIFLSGDTRFFKGIELELTVPQAYFNYRGSLALALYGDLSKVPQEGVADVEAKQILFEPMPNKLQIIYQIPLRQGHGLKATPYASLLPGPALPSSFPLLFRIMPVVKGITGELEAMLFNLNARPILSNEGAVRLSFLYPEQLRDKAFAVLIDDKVVDNPMEDILLPEGIHSLVILSNDYRNESKRFQVERAKVLDLAVELQDPTPLLIFEAPENAQIYLDNGLLFNAQTPCPVEPGIHEVKFQVGDYSIVKSITVQKGKTYRVALSVDLNISEE